jgi:epoxide hydrolase 4
MAAQTVPHPDDFQHEMIQAGGLNMHIVTEGAPEAPAVVMLHGFPEFWYSWRHQIKPLAQAGYRVIVPDLRGYNLTDKTSPYDTFTLANDILNLINTLGYDRVHLVGHDWGGAIAWLFAALYPERLNRLVVVNLPHPNAYARAMRRFYLPQVIKSWYILFFQLPFIPEFLLGAFNSRGLSTMMKLASPTMTAQELGDYRAAWSQPGALPAMLGYYRSLFRNQRALSAPHTVTVPTRLIWGHPDVALSFKVAQQSAEWCTDFDLKVLPQTGHFVQQQAPEQVTDYIQSFLSSQTND